MLSHLGQSRTSIQPRHALLTPESYERVMLPGMEGAELIYLISPVMGARLTMYLIDASKDVELPAVRPKHRRFALLLGGSAKLSSDHQDLELHPEDFAFFPHSDSGRLYVAAGAKIVVLEWVAEEGLDAEPLNLVSGSVTDSPRQPLKGDETLVVQNLLPKNPKFDAEVNIMNFAPGASLPYVETHFMEHGLLFLDGEGIYRLGDRWYPVVKGDAIWMGPHELQWFGALGKVPSRYLIWKNFNRRP
ncbi:(S)-ureidoglycine aminohydrolase [Mesorhizobium sp. SB112]|uniref:(S)-ureidoglycine aminohydrolase n=1 Tax=Mesorhizobium sp. SB112 TaxID=3151853 RepID=UPI003267AE74